MPAKQVKYTLHTAPVMSSFWFVFSISACCGIAFAVTSYSQVTDDIIRDPLQDHTCSTYRTKLVVAYPGCIPKSVHMPACHGKCHSFAIPEWVPEKSHIHMIENCKCCKPLVVYARSVVLECPDELGTRTIRVRGAMECQCRPCSHGNPEAEQPYDY